MSGLDSFAWIVPISSGAGASGVPCIAGELPGPIEETSALFFME